MLRPATTPATARNDRHSSLLQLAAWGVPAALAAAVLVTRDVDADELTGKFLEMFRSVVSYKLPTLSKSLCRIKIFLIIY